MASTYLTRAQASGNRRTVTFSAWVKRSALGDKNIFNGTDNSSEFTALYFTSADELFLYDWRGAEGMNIRTTQKFRDTSAWYHIVVAFDTTQATASNRVKIYVNGSQVTDFATSNYPAQNLDLMLNVNSSFTTKIGVYPTSNTLYFDGYMAHVHFTEGTQYAASDFGETDTNGQWSPIPTPSVTYGTNGFFLKFANSGSLGTDSSGNGNNFTKNGSGDQVTDTPDNVFATWNPLCVNPSATNTFAEGNLQCTSGGAMATLAMPSGQWYWEVRCSNSDADQAIGAFSVTEGGQTSLSGTTNPTHGFIYQANGNARRNGTVEETWSTFTNGDIIGFTYSASTRVLTAYKNGTLAGDITLTDSGDVYSPIVMPLGGNFIANFGQDGTFAGNETAQGNSDDNGYGDFYYSPPTGFLALCTKNLAETLTLPIDDGSQYFNTVLYSGNGGTSRSITGMGFQSDFLWHKDRSSIRNHSLVDSTRGTNASLQSNSNAAESTMPSFVSFDSDGFTITQDGSTNPNWNESGVTKVVWGWKTNGGTTSSNTDGSITSTVQVNSTAGMSIVSYTSSGANATVGHGLGATPDFIILKTRSKTGSWPVYHNALALNEWLYLDTTNSKLGPASSTWREMTSTTFGVGTSDNWNFPSGNTYIAYCFKNVEGYSKAGSYIGNGSTDGTFIYTGFRPAFVITKRINSADDWSIHDNKRLIINGSNYYLNPNLSNAEITTYQTFNILSNGFKLVNTDGKFNASGGSYIYMAFAENPFVDSTGRPVTAQ